MFDAEKDCFRNIGQRDTYVRLSTHKAYSPGLQTHAEFVNTDRDEYRHDEYDGLKAMEKM